MVIGRIKLLGHLYPFISVSALPRRVCARMVGRGTVGGIVAHSNATGDNVTIGNRSHIAPVLGISTTGSTEMFLYPHQGGHLGRRGARRRYQWISNHDFGCTHEPILKLFSLPGNPSRHSPALARPRKRRFSLRHRPHHHELRRVLGPFRIVARLFGHHDADRFTMCTNHARQRERRLIGGAPRRTPDPMHRHEESAFGSTASAGLSGRTARRPRRRGAGRPRRVRKIQGQRARGVEGRPPARSPVPGGPSRGRAAPLPPGAPTRPIRDRSPSP